MLARLGVVGVIAVLILIPWRLGVSEAYTARITIACLKMTGFDHIHPIDAVRFVISQKGYVINFWCTPSVLSLCGITLLWFAQLRPLVYLFTCVGFTFLSGVLILGSTVLSVHLHQRGIDWVWAHYPGAILVYSGSLIGCLFFAEIRQHRLGQASAVAQEELLMAETYSR